MVGINSEVGKVPESAKRKQPKGGSRKGVPNKVTKQLKDMILGALDAAGGQDYLQRQAEENPGPFLALVGKVLPTTLAGDPNAPLTARIEVAFVGAKRDD